VLGFSANGQTLVCFQNAVGNPPVDQIVVFEAIDANRDSGEFQLQNRRSIPLSDAEKSTDRSIRGTSASELNRFGNYLGNEQQSIAS
jgi:hypothetical protein